MNRENATPRLISNSVNLDINPDHYDLDNQLLEKLFTAVSKIHLDIPHQTITEKAIYRPRQKQCQESACRLQGSLIATKHTKWLEEQRKISKTHNIFDIDYEKLHIRDLYDYYIIPEDYYIDKHGNRPVIGPVFPDIRNGELVGICIRNLSDEKDYVADVKYTFSNCGWYLYGHDDCKPDDEVYIVEGVFDAIAMRSYGYKAIAIGASSPTPMHLAMLLKRYKKLNLCLDNDLAGYIGSYITSLLLNINVYTTPKFKDIATSWESDSKLELEKLNKQDLQYLIAESLKNHKSERHLPYN